MENKELMFTIISNDDIVILEAIQEYNKIYNTDFCVMRFLYDEAVFAEIKVTKYQISNIFDLGYFFHSMATLKREQGQIDW